jgi:hypothetical protein
MMCRREIAIATEISWMRLGRVGVLARTILTGTGFATTGAFRGAFIPKHATTIPARRFTMAAVILPHAMGVQTRLHATLVRGTPWRTGLVFIRGVRMQRRAILMGLRVAMMAPALTPVAPIPLRATLTLRRDVMMDLACIRVAQTLQHAIGMNWRVVTMAVARTQDARLKDFAITMPRRVVTMAVVKTRRVLAVWIRRLATSVNTQPQTMGAAIFHATDASMPLRATTTRR